MARSYIRHYKDSVILFYDSEFGTPQSYFDNFGIPQNRVVHTPITDIEELRHDLSVQIDNITRTDKVIIVIDSLGNLASRKEVTDALEGNEKSDMTRAKVIKSMFRIITPKLTLKNIPLVVINHTYKEMGMFPKDIVSGGTGSYLAADNIWVLGRRQDKDGNEISGYDFIINIEKSRYVREKSKIPITISYDGGINKWSGLLDLAIEAGYIVSPTKGWYSTVDKNTGEVGTQKMRAGDIEDSDDFWKKMFSETDFAAWIENKYKLANGRIISDGEEE
jgi:RecA/RadA recombinase